MRKPRAARRRRSTPRPSGAAPARPRTESAEEIAAISAIAAANGESVRRLIQEVADFRLALETDLTIAAAAADSGAPAIAADVVEASRRELASLSRRAEGGPRLAALPAPLRPIAGQRRVRVPLAAVVGVAVAAALIGAAAGAGFVDHPAPPPAAPGTAVLDLAALAAAQQAGVLALAAHQHLSQAQVLAAATALHQRLQPLLANAAHDPDAARTALQLLGDEQQFLTENGESTDPQVRAVLAQLQQSTAQMRTVTAPSVLADVSTAEAPPLGLTPLTPPSRGIRRGTTWLSPSTVRTASAEPSAGGTVTAPARSSSAASPPSTTATPSGLPLPTGPGALP